MEQRDICYAMEKYRALWRAKYDAVFEPDKVEIGDYTYGMPVVLSWGEKNAKLKIGKFCSIGGNVQIYLGGNHHTDWCTTFPFNALFPEIWGDIDGGVAATKGDVIIGNDVWIGNNVAIMSGVRIGDGSAIAAGSVISRNVPAYSVMAGNPAKQRKIRAEAAMIQELQWWDWPVERIAETARWLMSGNVFNLKQYWEGMNSETFFLCDRPGAQ